MTALTLAVFALSYALIASRRFGLLPIGRPAGALLGAVLMVAIGALSPEESYRAIDHDTLVLLFGMMLLSAYAERAGLFELLGAFVLGRARSGGALLVLLAVLSGGLSALLVNDTVCLFLTPLVVSLCTRAGLPLLPYLLALATSANLGSAATLVGNPQNMLIGSMSGLSFVRFFALVGPAALVGLSLNVALMRLVFRSALQVPLERVALKPAVVSRRQAALVGAVLFGIVIGYLAGLHLGYTTLAGVLVLVVLDRREPREAFSRVDWPLLVFFASLFIVVGGLRATGLCDEAWQRVAPAIDPARPEGLLLFTVVVVVGSNLLSNVPLVLLFGPYLETLSSPALGWALLAYVSTVAGNLTLVGSVANLIVAERARGAYELGFLEYLRFGALSVAVSLVAGVPALYAMAALLR